MIPTTSNAEGSKTTTAKDQAKEIQVERRSERLVKDVILTTQEKNEAMARKRNVEGINVKTHSIVDMDNDVLGKLAKNMCVLVHDNAYATFDLLKDLESARNCLNDKHAKLSKNNLGVEIVEFDPSIEIVLIEDEKSDEDPDLEMLIIQKSNGVE